MIFREATLNDISQMHCIRMSVKENVLSNPDLVKEADYIRFLEKEGRGWIAEVNKEIVGFAIIDKKSKNIWALFVKPGFEKMGIGRQLHDMMLNWYFNLFREDLWLGTAPNTRAAAFYTTAGWTDRGLSTNGEIRFEISRDVWLKNKYPAKGM